MSSHRLLAHAVSLIFHPAVVSAAAIAYVAAYYAPSPGKFWLWFLTASALIIGPAALYSLSTLAKDRRIDLNINNRQDRIVPLLLSSLGALVSSYLISSRVEIGPLTVLSTVLVAMLISLTITTFVWKVSIHTGAVASLLTLLVLFGGGRFLALYLILPAIVWSRLYLKQHTAAQLIAGIGEGIGVTVLAWLIFASRT